MFEEMVVSSPNPKKTISRGRSSSRCCSGRVSLDPDSHPSDYTEALPKTMMATMLTAPPPPRRRPRLRLPLKSCA